MISLYGAYVNAFLMLYFSGYTLGMKYAAMIRGIGPTNPNMKGARLAEAFESCGFTDVRPFLGSGNVLFTSELNSVKELELRAEAALPRLLGFSRDVFIRSEADLQKIVAANPFGDLKHENSGKTYLTITFFKGRRPNPDTRIPGRQSRQSDTSIFDTSGIGPLPYKPEGKAFELVASIDGALCCATDLTTGKTPDLMQWLERHYGKRLTTRTWSTITRIVTKF
jgi:hypothetical protein